LAAFTVTRIESSVDLTALSRDILRLMGVGGGRAVTTVLPGGLDAPLAGLLGALAPVGALRRRMTADLGAGVNVDQVARRHVRMRIENTLGRLREAGGAGRWSPRMDLVGEEHLRSAAEGGRGAIVWRMSFTSAVVVHAAIARTGTRLVHLSRPVHGAGSGSPVGYRVLAPIYCRAEEVHLEERVLIPEDGTLGYMKELMAVLRRGGTLSIFGEQRARTNTEAVLFGRPTGFAQGAPALAHRMDVPLLLQHARWIGPGHYEVTIEPPLEVDRSMDRGAFVEHAVARFAARLEDRIRAHPESWTGW
jgi:lauroyl/myristoyl acyltransferase